MTLFKAGGSDTSLIDLDEDELDYYLRRVLQNFACFVSKFMSTDEEELIFIKIKYNHNSSYNIIYVKMLKM